MNFTEIKSQLEKSFDMNKTIMKIYRNKQPVREILSYEQNYNEKLPQKKPVREIL